MSRPCSGQGRVPPSVPSQCPQCHSPTGLHQHLPRGVCVPKNDLQPIPGPPQGHLGHTGAPQGEEPAALTHHQQLQGSTSCFYLGLLCPSRRQSLHIFLFFFIFFFSLQKAFGCVQRALQTNFSRRVLQKNDILVLQPALLPSANTVF